MPNAAPGQMVVGHEAEQPGFRPSQCRTRNRSGAGGCAQSGESLLGTVGWSRRRLESATARYRPPPGFGHRRCA